MFQRETRPVAAELKYVGDDTAPGVFEGYGSVFNNEDWNGDVVLPGAFAKTLAAYKSKGKLPGLYAEHSPYMFGGDPLPVGVWTEMEEDSKGLRVKGKLSALDTDSGRRLRGLLLDGAIEGLSIAFQVTEGGATAGTKAGEPRRTLNAIHLLSVDLVRDPANEAARVEHVKSVLAVGDHRGAADHIASAMKMCRDCLTGGNSPTVEQRGIIMDHLQGAHKALTGEPLPAGLKSLPRTIREYEAWLRDEFGLSNSAARQIAESGFKSATPPRDEDGSAREAVNDMTSTLAGFSLLTG